MASDPASNGSSESSREGRKKSWSELPLQQRRAIALAGIVELVLTTIALRDLGRRSASAVRGPKPLWFVGCFIQPFGPITYLLVGRRKHAS